MPALLARSGTADRYAPLPLPVRQKSQTWLE